MKKKEFKMLIATNPVLRQWLKENALWLKAKPEVMFYITQHPDALKHFRSAQPIDNEKISRHAGMYVNQVMEERVNRRGKKGKIEEKDNPENVRKPKKGLLSGLKSMFSKPLPVPVSASANLPSIQPPGIRQPGRKPMPGPSPKSLKAPAFHLPKLKINRSKMMDTLNQTTEMLDVVAALMGKVGNMK